MKKHQMKHTGRILFTCSICEFESTRQSMLEDPKESKHGIGRTPRIFFPCDICESKFPYFLLKKHVCVPVSKFPCGKCQFASSGLMELSRHMDEAHVQKKAEDSDPIAAVKENSSKASEEKTHAAIKCDQCAFAAENIPSFISHIRAGHTYEGESCQYCEHIAQDKNKLKDHMYDNHAEVVMIHTMAKQMNDVS